MTEKKPRLKLVGRDGNAFLILGSAIGAAKKAKWPEEKIEKFKKSAMGGDYDNLLRICMEHFDVV
ncbi:unnamed protein product [marine sediment metagenome]|uniref:Uncharacterized protein n=1 Tax=marine sediment metagenome TaxID=412755 RepID=X0YSB9_9ZZZZ